MSTTVHQTTLVGDLIAAVFDEAAQYSSDQRDISRLATEAVLHMLSRARSTLPRAKSEACGRAATRARCRRHRSRDVVPGSARTLTEDLVSCMKARSLEETAR